MLYASGPSTCHNKYDFIEYFKQGIIRNEDHDINQKINKIPKSPHIMCTLNNNKIQCLIDSGSQVTAISEKVYENIYIKIKKY